MKNKILKILLAISIMADVGGYINYEHKLEIKHEQISTLQENVETKSNQIAKLDSVIKLQNEKALEKQEVIDNDYNIINELKNNAKKLQKEKNRILAENFKKEQKGSDVESRKLTVSASAYISMCREGCTGRTATGIDISNTIYYKGYRVIATDPSIIPLNSLVRVETNSGTFIAMAIDKGGAIRGNRIDILVGSTSEAIKFGRKQAKVTILRYGN